MHSLNYSWAPLYHARFESRHRYLTFPPFVAVPNMARNYVHWTHDNRRIWAASFENRSTARNEDFHGRCRSHSPTGKRQISIAPETIDWMTAICSDRPISKYKRTASLLLEYASDETGFRNGRRKGSFRDGSVPNRSNVIDYVVVFWNNTNNWDFRWSIHPCESGAREKPCPNITVRSDPFTE